MYELGMDLHYKRSASLISVRSPLSKFKYCFNLSRCSCARNVLLSHVIHVPFHVWPPSL